MTYYYGISILDFLRIAYDHVKCYGVYKGSIHVLVPKALHRETEYTHTPKINK